MKKFLLLAGVHYISDDVFVRARGRQDQAFVFSDDDLVAIHGAGKFEFVCDVAPVIKEDVKDESKKEVKAK
jgi:hypothetical protein